MRAVPVPTRLGWSPLAANHSGRARLAAPLQRPAVALRGSEEGGGCGPPGALPDRLEERAGGHFVCIAGYADGGEDAQFVAVFDPLFPDIIHGPADLREMPFEVFRNDYRLGASVGRQTHTN